MLVRLKQTETSATSLWDEAIAALVLMMAPIFPHISEELWHRLGHTESVHLQTWPQGDPYKTPEDSINVVVQVNGKVRGKLVVPPGANADDLESQALGLDVVKKWIDGKTVRKVVVVPDKLVNIVAG
jgi:leucyl-tRNA synthetase